MNARVIAALCISVSGAPMATAVLAQPPCHPANTVEADVVAIDMPIVFNRLGAQNVNWQIFALRHDLVARDAGGRPRPATEADIERARGGAASVALRPDLRPRPLTLRVAAGECLRVRFTNLLTPVSNPFDAHRSPLLPAGHPMDHRSTDPNMDSDNQVASRSVGFHPNGLQLVEGIASDASHVGRNASSLAAPGQTRTYTFFAPAEGAFLVTNPGAAFGGEGTAGASGTGLFAVVAVQPAGARAYRGQVTEEELRLATRLMTDPAVAGQPVLPCAADPQRACTRDGHPVIDYEAVYPAQSPWLEEGKAGLPILAIEQRIGNARRIVHGDINAIIVGPEPDGRFPPSTYPLESTGVANPSLPNRLEPFREFVSVFHDENAAAQAFPGLFEHPVLGHTLHGVRDSFMINYGSAGVGAEVIANRLRVGPMHDCVDCAFEEFFLSSFTVGDPALLVDRPANLGLEQFTVGTLPGPDLAGVNLDGVFAKGIEDQLARLEREMRKRFRGQIALQGPKATKSFYPHDPANVHHSYLNDFVKFRNLHTGKEQHIFHLHNHQWLFNPNDDNSNYIDAQAIGPGSGYTYEIAFGGSGNRNKSAGDAVFHCHYYPHFAQGMWYLWRIHDTFEPGTVLQASGGSARRPSFHREPFALADGTPAEGARALPDGEIARGTPIPAVVPLPGKALAPMPGEVVVVANPRSLPDGRPVGSLAKVIDRDRNPGFPFWIAGIEDAVGSRPPTPPLDMVAEVGGADGGVPRHAVLGYSAGSKSKDTFTRLDVTKKELLAKPVYFPERGTDLERVAMAFHAQPFHPSSAVLPDGRIRSGVRFETNGGKPEPGAPFFDPCVDDARQRLAAGHVGRFFGAHGLSLRGNSPFNADTPRIYKGANIQLDVTINKLGDHYPQQRIIALWEDVDATLATGFRKLPGAAQVKQPRPPEPLVLRMNTFDCARFLHTNLVPKEFELDDYQVRTPTDVIGQHIHLPKWDLVAADGSANGWNYEDGTFSPGMVRSRIQAINAWNQAHPTARVPNPYAPGQPAFDPAAPPVAPDADLRPRAHYFFGRGGPFQRPAQYCEQAWVEKGYEAFHNDDINGLARPGECDWLGARTTIQRWFSDPIVNKEHRHRGLGITFTHDHLGPSTHQQAGLYATMLTEPPDSTWVHNETAELLYSRNTPGTDCSREFAPGAPTKGRCDGGPTSWQAVIRTANPEEWHREFFLQFGDFQHAYRMDEYRGVDAIGLRVRKDDPGNAQSFRKAAQPSHRQPASPNFPDVVALPAQCPGSDGKPLVLKRRAWFGAVREYAAAPGIAHVPRPCPEIISADDVGTMVVNYRQEPVAARVMSLEGRPAHDPGGAQARQTAGRAGDLAFAFQTRTDRALTALNTVTGESSYPPLTFGVQPGDPYTPILRAYSGDLVRIKVQAGSHEHEHNIAVNGLKWLQGGSGFGRAPHSGWRSAQNIGLSEQFTLTARITDYFVSDRLHATDRLYALDTSQDGLWNGAWGVVRTLSRRASDDRLVPLPANARPTLLAPLSPDMRRNDCPPGAPLRSYHLVAGLANRLLAPATNVHLRAAGGVEPAGGTLVYNPRPHQIRIEIHRRDDDPATPADERGQIERVEHLGAGPLHDPTAILIVPAHDIDPDTGRLKPGAAVEPIVLRAAAGDCIEITLENRLPARRQEMPDLAGFTTLSMLMPKRLGSGTQDHTSFNNNHVRPSNHIGLHPQLVHYDVQLHDASAVGLNRASLAAPGEAIRYKWFAGELTYDAVQADAAQCLESQGAHGGYGLLNKLRQHEREFEGRTWLLRPPNHLFTAQTLLTRLEALLAPPTIDTGEPAADDAVRDPARIEPRQVRQSPLGLSVDAELQTRLRELRQSGATLRLFKPVPPNVGAAAWQALLARTLKRLLAEPTVRDCLDTLQPPQPRPPELPGEVREAALAVLGQRIEPQQLASAFAGTGDPSASFSLVEALERREECAKKTLKPIAVALRDALSGTNLEDRVPQLALALAASIAYQVPELDEDALGGEQFARAFAWYRNAARAELAADNARLVTPAPRAAACRFAAIEYGGTNLTPPDRIKQGQKAAVGALVIEPQGSLWLETDRALDRQNTGAAAGALRATRTTAHVFYPAKVETDPETGRVTAASDWRYLRDLVAVHQKGLNLRYGSTKLGRSTAVGPLAAERENAHQPLVRVAPEDAHDSGHMAINYGTEPLWFRYGVDPSAPFGHGPRGSTPPPGEGFGGIGDAHRAFANACCLGPDGRSLPAADGPYTPIFSVAPLAETRLRLLMPTGVGRGTTIALHGHGWQRDPYLAENTGPLAVSHFTEPGLREMGGLYAPAGAPERYGVPSRCQGKNALGMWLGAQESVTPMAHFDLLLERAGGAFGVPGDYLMRDIGGFGVTSGLWALMRVEGKPVPSNLRKGLRASCH